MSKKVKAIFLTIGLIIFILLINEFGFKNILINIKRTGWWILPITGTWLVVYLLNSLAWKIILKPYRNKFSFGEILAISISGFAINYITPVINLGGEPYKIFALKEKLETSNAVSSVLLYSMLHFLSSFIFWIAAILLVLFSLSLSSDAQLIFGAGFLIALSGVWFFLSRHRKGIFRGLINLIPKLPFTKKISEKLKPQEKSLTLIDDQIITFYNKSRSDFFTALFLEVAARFVASVEFIFILHAIGLSLSFENAIYINAFSSFVMNIFFFIPLGLGIREGSIFFVMNILRFSSGIGIYIGLVTRIRELIWIFIGLILINFRKTKLSKENIMATRV